MGTVVAFLGTFLLSLFVALLAALQLGDFFQANEEFILVLMVIPVVTFVAMAAFAIAYAAARSVRLFNRIATSLIVLVLALVLVPGLVQKIADRSTNPYTVWTENTSIMLELLVPLLLTILVQWGLVRRRWLRARGLEDLTRWPWVTTIVAGLVILNPFGLAVVSSAIAYAPTDWLGDLWLGIALAAAAVLIVMAAIECYIRGRMLRRRVPTSPSLVDTGAAG